jgi:stage II sporulation protein R
MKQGIFAIVLAIIILGGLMLFGTPQTQNAQTTYLRIHVRANSNSEFDQNVKYKVKDDIVNFLTPLLVEGTTVQRAKSIVQKELKKIEQNAEKVLVANNFYYKAKASFKEENFPTRTYDDLTLESGYYQALIVELGEGEGDNWWCVIYPPLCFVSQESGKIVYKSKLMEIIENFKKKFI